MKNKKIIHDSNKNKEIYSSYEYQGKWHMYLIMKIQREWYIIWMKIKEMIENSDDSWNNNSMVIKYNKSNEITTFWS